MKINRILYASNETTTFFPKTEASQSLKYFFIRTIGTLIPLVSSTLLTAFYSYSLSNYKTTYEPWCTKNQPTTPLPFCLTAIRDKQTVKLTITATVALISLTLFLANLIHRCHKNASAATPAMNIQTPDI